MLQYLVSLVTSGAPDTVLDSPTTTSDDALATIP
jgi:hypothetical protein